MEKKNIYMCMTFITYVKWIIFMVSLIRAAKSNIQDVLRSKNAGTCDILSTHMIIHSYSCRKIHIYIDIIYHIYLKQKTRTD